MVGIKDFGMPSCCMNCDMYIDDGEHDEYCCITATNCKDSSEKNDDCPLVEISEFNAVSNKELRQILQEIKNDCSDHRDCQGCKFDMYDGCALCEIPDEWKLDKIGLAESEET